MIEAFIGIGSNLDSPQQQVNKAIECLNTLPNTSLVAASSLYRSAPIGPQDQPDFINAVALIATKLKPIELLDQLQQLEKQAGRVKLRHWGERCLDLDILLYGNQTIDHQRLTVPHKEISNRAFVLMPLVEIRPHQQLPSGKLAKELLELLGDQAISRLID